MLSVSMSEHQVQENNHLIERLHRHLFSEAAREVTAMLGESIKVVDYFASNLTRKESVVVRTLLVGRIKKYYQDMPLEAIESNLDSMRE